MRTKQEARDYARAYYHRTKEARMPLLKAQRKKLSDNRREYRAANRMRDAVASIKSRAKKWNIPFNLTEEDVPVPEYCPVFPWIKLGWGLERENIPSIDKVVPSIGYMKGNVKVISLKANVMKSNATAEELQCILNYVLENAPRLDH